MYAFMEINEYQGVSVSVEKAFGRDYTFTATKKETPIAMFGPYVSVILDMFFRYTKMDKVKGPCDRSVPCHVCSLVSFSDLVCTMCKKKYCGNCSGRASFLHILNDPDYPTASSIICKTCERMLDFMDNLSQSTK